MFYYTAGSIQTIFETGSYFEQSSVGDGDQLFTVIRPSNGVYPVCQVVSSNSKTNLFVLSDSSHDTIAVFENKSLTSSLSNGSVLLITEYSLINKQSAVKKFGGVETDYQYQSTKSVTNANCSIFVVVSFQLIGIDHPKITEVHEDTVNLLMISSLRPHLIKTSIRFKGLLTQKGSNFV